MILFLALITMRGISAAPIGSGVLIKGEYGKHTGRELQNFLSGNSSAGDIISMSSVDLKNIYIEHIKALFPGEDPVVVIKNSVEVNPPGDFSNYHVGYFKVDGNGTIEWFGRTPYPGETFLSYNGKIWASTWCWNPVSPPVTSQKIGYTPPQSSGGTTYYEELTDTVVRKQTHVFINEEDNVYYNTNNFIRNDENYVMTNTNTNGCFSCAQSATFVPVIPASPVYGQRVGGGGSSLGTTILGTAIGTTIGTVAGGLILRGLQPKTQQYVVVHHRGGGGRPGVSPYYGPPYVPPMPGNHQGSSDPYGDGGGFVSNQGGSFNSNLLSRNNSFSRTTPNFQSNAFVKKRQVGGTYANNFAGSSNSLVRTRPTQRVVANNNNTALVNHGIYKTPVFRQNNNFAARGVRRRF